MGYCRPSLGGLVTRVSSPSLPIGRWYDKYFMESVSHLLRLTEFI